MSHFERMIVYNFPKEICIGVLLITVSISSFILSCIFSFDIISLIIAIISQVLRIKSICLPKGTNDYFKIHRPFYGCLVDIFYYLAVLSFTLILFPFVCCYVVCVLKYK